MHFFANLKMFSVHTLLLKISNIISCGYFLCFRKKFTKTVLYMLIWLLVIKELLRVIDHSLLSLLCMQKA